MAELLFSGFSDILKEEGFPDDIIAYLWELRPPGGFTEKLIRASAVQHKGQLFLLRMEMERYKEGKKARAEILKQRRL